MYVPIPHSVPLHNSKTNEPLIQFIMSHFQHALKKNARTACPKRKHYENEPKPGLAYTPSDMARMHAAGMPVNSANLINSFCDGDKNPSFVVPIERKRGVDIAEVWEESKNAQAKIEKFGKSIKNSKKTS